MFFMKRFLVGICVVAISAVPAMAGEFHIMSGIGFTAPNVTSHSDVGNPQIGDIVFDTTTGSFFGYGGGTPSWLPFGAPNSYKAPTVSIATTNGTSKTGGFNGSSTTYTTPTNPSPLYIRVR